MLNATINFILENSGWICVVNDTWSFFLVKTFSVITIFFKLANHQIRHQAHIKWAHMTTSIFLRGLCGYVSVNILTLLPPRVNQI